MIKKLFSIFIVFLLIISGIDLGLVQANSQISQKPLNSPDIPRLSSGLFTENKGQWDESILYMGNTSFGKVAFTKDPIYYQLIKTEKRNEKDINRINPKDRFDSMSRLSEKQVEQEQERTVKFESQIIKLSFVNSQTPNIKPEGLLTHYNNYFLGNDPKKWATECHNYTKVYYEDIWNGIDLAYFFNDKGLKYEFYAKPNSDITDIKIEVQGANLELENNELKIDTPIGSIFDSKLIAYTQESNKEISVCFNKEDKTYGFQIEPNFKTNETIIIDPLIYSTFVGGSHDDYGYSIAIDSHGNAYVAGNTGSPDFPTTVGAYDTTFNGHDVFVFKLNQQVSDLIYSTFVGGSYGEDGSSIAIDSQGNAYVTGNTGSPDFPTTVGAYDTTHNGNSDVVVFKLNPQGSALIYSTFVGGNVWDDGDSIAIDSEGNAYVTGSTDSSDFPTTVEAYDTTYNGGGDAFVFKLQLFNVPSSEVSIAINATFDFEYIDHWSFPQSTPTMVKITKTESLLGAKVLLIPCFEPSQETKEYYEFVENNFPNVHPSFNTPISQGPEEHKYYLETKVSMDGIAYFKSVPEDKDNDYIVAVIFETDEFCIKYLDTNNIFFAQKKISINESNKNTKININIAEENQNEFNFPKDFVLPSGFPKWTLSPTEMCRIFFYTDKAFSIFRYWKCKDANGKEISIIVTTDKDRYPLAINAYSNFDTSCYYNFIEKYDSETDTWTYTPGFIKLGGYYCHRSLSHLTLWHEFGHFLMDMLYRNNKSKNKPNSDSEGPKGIPRWKDGDLNHLGFANSESLDSYIEGFATFISLYILHQMKLKGYFPAETEGVFKMLDSSHNVVSEPIKFGEYRAETGIYEVDSPILNLFQGKWRKFLKVNKDGRLVWNWGVLTHEVTYKHSFGEFAVADLLLSLVDDNSWYPSKKNGDGDSVSINCQTLLDLLSNYTNPSFGGVQDIED